MIPPHWPRVAEPERSNPAPINTTSLMTHTNGAFANRTPLDNSSLALRAPSIFAAQAMDGVSSRYTYLPTAAIVDGMRQAGWLPVHAEEQRVRLDGRKGFQKHIIRFQRQGQALTKGEYTTEVCLINSHDRSSGYQIHAGLFRLICGNGMMVADTTFQHISIRHTNLDPQAVTDASFKLLEGIPAITANVEIMRARRLTPAESQAFAESALILRYDDPAAAPIRAEKLLTPRRCEDQGDDLWKTLNRVQENLVRGGVKDYTMRKPNGQRMPRTRAITGLDENVKLNKALWHLAEALRAGNLPASN